MDDERLKNKNYIDAWKKAISGIWYAAKTQTNIKVQIVVSTLVIIASILLKFNYIEFLFVIFAIAMVLITETINTAIETAVNLVTDKYHELAKITKDVAAGAVVLSAINAVTIWLIIIVNKAI